MRAEFAIQYHTGRGIDGAEEPTAGTFNVIVAPHNDDEVIGCFEIMSANTNFTVMPCMFYDMRKASKCIVDAREDESVRAQKSLTGNYDANRMRPVDPMKIGSTLESYCKRTLDATTYDNIICWFPDPDWETHQHHKFVGMMGRYLADKWSKEHCPVMVGFYSVNMKAPYVHVLSQEAQEKKRKACEHFVSQSEYFAQNQHSWIFEGRYLV